MKRQSDSGWEDDPPKKVKLDPLGDSRGGDTSTWQHEQTDFDSQWVQDDSSDEVFREDQCFTQRELMQMLEIEKKEKMINATFVVPMTSFCISCSLHLCNKHLSEHNELMFMVNHQVVQLLEKKACHFCKYVTFSSFVSYF